MRDVKSPALSLIVAVYNRENLLRLILEACAIQTFRDFEVLVADDGSGPGLAALLRETNGRFPFMVRHVWQEDKGWRKNRIMNRAIAAALGEYLVFIDGDCIPHTRFLEDHYRGREENTVLGGRRAEMSERWSRSLTVERIRSGRYQKLGWREWMDGIRGRAAGVEAGLRFRVHLFGRLLHRNRRGLLGSNFSIAKRHLVTINGFDERYDGPGCGEDTDIAYRLSLAGIRLKILRHRAIQFHVFHPRTVPPARTHLLLQDVMAAGKYRCEFGVDRHIEALTSRMNGETR